MNCKCNIHWTHPNDSTTGDYEPTKQYFCDCSGTISCSEYMNMIEEAKRRRS